jgi:hypothetical protein
MSGANDLDNHFAIREAALHKFRQKRKERCFEKKVMKPFAVSLLIGIFQVLMQSCFLPVCSAPA